MPNRIIEIARFNRNSKGDYLPTHMSDCFRGRDLNQRMSNIAHWLEEQGYEVARFNITSGEHNFSVNTECGMVVHTNGFVHRLGVQNEDI